MEAKGERPIKTLSHAIQAYARCALPARWVVGIALLRVRRRTFKNRAMAKSKNLNNGKGSQPPIAAPETQKQAIRRNKNPIKTCNPGRASLPRVSTDRARRLANTPIRLRLNDSY